MSRFYENSVVPEALRRTTTCTTASRVGPGAGHLRDRGAVFKGRNICSAIFRERLVYLSGVGWEATR